MATWAPASMSRSSLSRIVWPAARTLTPSRTIATPDGAAAGERGGMGGNGGTGCLWGGLFGRPQGFQEAEGHIAMGGVLPGHERHLLAENREVQGPVDEEQHATAFAGPRQVAEQQPGGEGEPEEGLHPLHAHNDALQPEAGTRPLGEQALVLASNGPLRRMGPHRDQPEEGVEVEAAQGAHMAADAEVPLLEEGLGQQRHANRERGCQPGERRTRRIEPGDPHRRQDELEGGAQELSAQVGQEPQRMGGVAALGHVRRQPALEVAIAEAGDLGEERQAQTRLEVSPEAQ